MFKNHPILFYLKYAVVAAILYCITAGIFIYNNVFELSYILYIGNMLFGICIGIFIWRYNKNRKENANAGLMAFAGHITTVMGIIITCMVLLVLIMLLAPDAFSSSQQVNEIIEQAPAQLQGKNRGLLMILFMNAIVGNVSAGSFISIIMPYTVKRNQKGDASRMTPDEIKIVQQSGK